ncbi:MAG TPA: crosslink repair DNA glycosylase YcaQ family protein, partial [Candidatus Limnocylindria bacterium]
LLATKPTRTVRLVGGFDQWVLGPGTDDARVLPTAHRRLVSKQSGWIAPSVVNGGIVSGTWALDGSRVEVAWFAGGSRIPRRALAEEVDRLGGLLGRDLALEVVRA